MVFYAFLCSARLVYACSDGDDVNPMVAGFCEDIESDDDAPAVLTTASSASQPVTKRTVISSRDVQLSTDDESDDESSNPIGSRVTPDVVPYDATNKPRDEMLKPLPPTASYGNTSRSNHSETVNQGLTNGGRTDNDNNKKNSSETLEKVTAQDEYESPHSHSIEDSETESAIQTTILADAEDISDDEDVRTSPAAGGVNTSDVSVGY